MSEENYIISVFNPTTRQAEEIAVSEAIRNEFRRGAWNIENNDRSFRKHETTITDLSGGQGGSYENFHEFRSDEDDPARVVAALFERRDLHQALTRLEDSDRELLWAIFIEGKSERRTAAEMGLPYMTVHSRKVRLLQKLKKIVDS